MTQMRRRIELLPWKAAGRVTERQTSGDDVVRTTGWVFNNETGPWLTLNEFVATGDVEVDSYLNLFEIAVDASADAALVEIGCGIGRMSSAFTRRFRTVFACDLDPGFLERCRETVAEFGRPDHLRTIEVTDGRTLDLPAACADYAFSFITLQHCEREDALALTAEAVRVVRPGGRVMLNYRAHGAIDALLLPFGALARGTFRIPGVGSWLSRRRTLTRLAWQANRFAPEQIVEEVGGRLTAVEIWQNPKRSLVADGAVGRTFDGINPNHWWLVATVAPPAAPD
jgi:SAM-dependent methyltransferase